jgi:hypothetical protein
MNEEDYINYINNYFKKKEIPVSTSAYYALLSRKYLNRELLSTLPEKIIHNNLDILLQDITDQYELRLTKFGPYFLRKLDRSRFSGRKGRIQGMDVLPVLRKRFCRLPPFCK